LLFPLLIAWASFETSQKGKITNPARGRNFRRALAQACDLLMFLAVGPAFVGDVLGDEVKRPPAAAADPLLEVGFEGEVVLAGGGRRRSDR
jgi:hypothetical protein